MSTALRPGRYDPNSQNSPDEASSRHDAMVSATSSLRPARTRRFPLEQVLLTLGGICIPAGVILIIVGWYGIAHTGFVFQQNAYLISGGILGLGLIVIGGFLYFAYWMTRQLRITESGTQLVVRAIARLETQMVAVAAASNASLANNGAGSSAGRNSAKVAVPSLVATERGSLLHRRDCPAVANKSNLREVDPDTPGFRPCQICNPFEVV